MQVLHVECDLDKESLLYKPLAMRILKWYQDARVTFCDIYQFTNTLVLQSVYGLLL